MFVVFVDQLPFCESFILKYKNMDRYVSSLDNFIVFCHLLAIRIRTNKEHPSHVCLKYPHTKGWTIDTEDGPTPDTCGCRTKLLYISLAYLLICALLIVCLNSLSCLGALGLALELKVFPVQNRSTMSHISHSVEGTVLKEEC